MQTGFSVDDALTRCRLLLGALYRRRREAFARTVVRPWSRQFQIDPEALKFESFKLNWRV